MTMLVSEILSKAADLIEPEGAWTQGYSARGADGKLTEPELVAHSRDQRRFAREVRRAVRKAVA